MKNQQPEESQDAELTKEELEEIEFNFWQRASDESRILRKRASERQKEKAASIEREQPFQGN